MCPDHLFYFSEYTPLVIRKEQHSNFLSTLSFDDQAHQSGEGKA